MVSNKVTFRPSLTPPNPTEVDYWIDLKANSNGQVIKTWDGVKWVTINQPQNDKQWQWLKDLQAEVERLERVKANWGTTLEDYHIEDAYTIEEVDNLLDILRNNITNIENWQTTLNPWWALGNTYANGGTISFTTGTDSATLITSAMKLGTGQIASISASVPVVSSSHAGIVTTEMFNRWNSMSGEGADSGLQLGETSDTAFAGDRGVAVETVVDSLPNCILGNNGTASKPISVNPTIVESGLEFSYSIIQKLDTQDSYGNSQKREFIVPFASSTSAGVITAEMYNQIQNNSAISLEWIEV